MLIAFIISASLAAYFGLRAIQAEHRMEVMEGQIYWLQEELDRTRNSKAPTSKPFDVWDDWDDDEWDDEAGE